MFRLDEQARNETARFYRLERAARRRWEPRPAEDLGLTACRELIVRAFRQINEPLPPSVMVCGVSATGRTRGTCSRLSDGSFLIGLPPARRRPWCVLHEAAHAARWGQGHGAGFVSLVVRLWQVAAWPEVDVSEIARDTLRGSIHVSA